MTYTNSSITNEVERRVRSISIVDRYPDQPDVSMNLNQHVERESPFNFPVQGLSRKRTPTNNMFRSSRQRNDSNTPIERLEEDENHVTTYDIKASPMHYHQQSTTPSEVVRSRRSSSTENYTSSNNGHLSPIVTHSPLSLRNLILAGDIEDLKYIKREIDTAFKRNEKSLGGGLQIPLPIGWTIERQERLLKWLESLGFQRNRPSIKDHRERDTYLLHYLKGVSDTQ